MDNTQSRGTSVEASVHADIAEAFADLSGGETANTPAEASATAQPKAAEGSAQRPEAGGDSKPVAEAGTGKPESIKAKESIEAAPQTEPEAEESFQSLLDKYLGGKAEVPETAVQEEPAVEMSPKAARILEEARKKYRDPERQLQWAAKQVADAEDGVEKYRGEARDVYAIAEELFPQFNAEAYKPYAEAVVRTEILKDESKRAKYEMLDEDMQEEFVSALAEKRLAKIKETKSAEREEKLARIKGGKERIDKVAADRAERAEREYFARLDAMGRDPKNDPGWSLHLWNAYESTVAEKPEASNDEIVAAAAKSHEADVVRFLGSGKSQSGNVRRAVLKMIQSDNGLKAIVQRMIQEESSKAKLIAPGKASTTNGNGTHEAQRAPAPSPMRNGRGLSPSAQMEREIYEEIAESVRGN